MNNVCVHRKKNHLNKAIVSYLRFQKKMLFLSNFFFFFFIPSPEQSTCFTGQWLRNQSV